LTFQGIAWTREALRCRRVNDLVAARAAAGEGVRALNAALELRGDPRESRAVATLLLRAVEVDDLVRVTQ
jgi:hypothetical protein